MNTTTTQPDDPDHPPAGTLAPSRPPSFATLKPQGMAFTPSRTTPTSPDR